MNGHTEYLTVQQACEALGQSESTFRRYARRLRVQPAEIGRGQGGKNLYRPQDVERIRAALGQPLDRALTEQPEPNGYHVTVQPDEDKRAFALAIEFALAQAKAAEERIAVAEKRAADAEARALAERAYANDAAQRQWETERENKALAAELAALRAVPTRPWWRRWWS